MSLLIARIPLIHYQMENLLYANIAIHETQDSSSLPESVEPGFNPDLGNTRSNELDEVENFHQTEA